MIYSAFMCTRGITFKTWNFPQWKFCIEKLLIFHKTAFASDKDKEQQMPNGATCHVGKPYVLRRLNVCTFQHVAHVEDDTWTWRSDSGGGEGASDIKPYEIVAPLAEIVFAPYPEFGTFWNVHYPVAASLKHEHVFRAINILRYMRKKKCCERSLRFVIVTFSNAFISRFIIYYI